MDHGLMGEVMEPEEVEGEPERVDDRNVRYREAVQQLDETVAVIAAELLEGL